MLAYDTKKYICMVRDGHTKAQDTNRSNVVFFISFLFYPYNFFFSVSAIEGSVSGLPVIADSGKRKILLLKGKEREISNVSEFIFCGDCMVLNHL